MDISKFEENMTVFGMRMHQDFVTYYNHLHKKGYTVDDVRTYLKIKSDETFATLKKANLIDYRIRCPECDWKMFIYPVNVSKGTLTGDPTERSVWMCKNNECLNTIYNKETIKELISKGGR